MIRPDLTPFTNVMVKGLLGERPCGLIATASTVTVTLECDEPFIDKGLIIYRTDSAHALLISEVRVEAEGTFKPDDTVFLESNLIPKTASASSGNNPNGIFDGIPFATDLEANPWWKVDLERYTLITTVHLEVEEFKLMALNVLTPSPKLCKNINSEADLVTPCSSILEGTGLQIRGTDPDPMSLRLLRVQIGTVPLSFDREFSQRDMPTDCAESYASGGFLTPGEELHSFGLGSTIASTKSVFCDRGWNVILRRGQFGNPIDYFNQNMDKYKVGFGDKNKEFWLGLDYLYHITNARDYRLKIELWDKDLNYRQANYGRFKILNNVTYNLEVEDFSSPSHAFVPDALGTANGMKFTTMDVDNDEDTTENCANIFEGPGWFKRCGDANLFGPNYNTKTAESQKAMFWRYFQGPTNSLSKIVMSITSSMTEPVAGTTASEAVSTEVASDITLEYHCINPEQSFVALKEFSFTPLTKVAITCSEEGVWTREPAYPVPCEDTFCSTPPEAPVGSSLKLYQYQGFPIVKDAAKYQFICEDGKIMTPYSGSGSLSIFEVPCPFTAGSIAWPSCQSSTLCPALNPPPASPQQGHVNLTDNGIKFGPCFGRSTNTPVALPSCPAIKVFVEDQEILASGQIKSKVDLMITASSSDLNSKITFSHELQSSSLIDITNGATLEDSTNLRTKVLHLVNLEPGLTEKHSVVFQYNQVPGLDLCVYDAICSDSQTELSTNSSLTNSLDVTAGKLGTKAMVRYSCGSATEFQKNSATEKFINLECLMDGNWNDSIILPPCVYVKCDVPPVNPGLSIWNWDGQPVPFGSAVQYRCDNGKKFQHDPTLDFVNATCKPGNTWEAPVGGWPTCIETKVCEDPPAKVEGGEMEVLSTGFRYGITCIGANGVKEIIPGQNTCNSPTIMLSKTFFYSNGMGEQMERRVYTVHVKTPSTVPKITSLLKFSIPPEHALEITGAVNTKLIPTKADTVFILQADLDISFAPNNSLSLIMDSKVGDSPSCLVEMQCSPCEEASDCQATIDNYHANLVKLVGGNIFKSSYQYKCPIGSKFASAGNTMAALNISCFWNQTWQPFASLPPCAPFGCANPILPSPDKNLNLTNYQSDQVVDFGFEAIFKCSDEFLFEEDRDLTDIRAVCNPNGTWTYPQWKQCVNPSTRYCPDPMASPSNGGSSDWDPSLSGKAAVGKQVTYTCSEAQDLRDSNDVVIPKFITTCQWNQTWVPEQTLTCNWNACIDPPVLPNMKASYLGKPVAFGADVVYTCESGFYFSDDKEKASISVKCLPDGSFDKSTLTFCVDTMYCLTEPPKAPIGGRRIWDGDIEFKAISTYTCGPNRVFLLDDNDGSTAKSLTSKCQWNTNWDRIELPLCIATACSKLPKPPASSNLEYLSSSQFKINTNPNEMFYNLTVPNSLPLPSHFGQESKLMLLARLKDKVEQNPVLQFISDNNDIGFHLEINLANENLDLTNDFIPGTNHHQFVIDEGDTFQIQIIFKPESFVFDIQLNEELSTEFQATAAISPITKLLIQGDFTISEMKFLTSDQVSTVPIGSILEFGCEGGRVFSHNWMIRPIVQTTCNKDGSFYEPTPWPSCVFPTTTDAPSTTPCVNETDCNSDENNGSGKFDVTNLVNLETFQESNKYRFLLEHDFACYFKRLHEPIEIGALKKIVLKNL
ncbi:uncharacterized protein LOC131890823 [Tigriopus californicus]|uniref:uncharacterized protein LOC131890823 n=1 Tax=Tigriopus californicus TaxID=6832 RepID=UPI0027DA5F3E|nr:uncharacterized protein LOC131890823 [Tigriopus californicus]